MSLFFICKRFILKEYLLMTFLKQSTGLLCYTLFGKIPLASNSTSYPFQIQPFGFQGHQLFPTPVSFNLNQVQYSLARGNRLSVSSTLPKKHIGRPGFADAAPVEWNSLPQTVRTQQTINGFRSQLKTHLFRLAYPPR